MVYLILFSPYSLTIASEEVKYNIVYKTDEYEIRLYPERLVVQTVNNNDGATFRKLFKYIKRKNNTSKKIEMIVPVTQYRKKINILCSSTFLHNLIKNQFPLHLT